MPDFTKKIMKNCADDLQAGEELLQATVGQPTGTFSRQAIGGSLACWRPGKLPACATTLPVKVGV